MKDIIISNKSILVAIFLLTIIFYLPILLNPSLLLSRNNDLQEFFWPIIYFIKQSVLDYHTLPLWNTVFLSGTPLLPDPQSMLFYPLNFIFILLPIDQAFIISFITHSFFGASSLYFFLKNCFHLSKFSMLFATSVYIISPVNAGLIEAGHFGLFIAISWIPLLLLSVVKVSSFPKKTWALILALCLSCIFFTHTLIFLFSTIITIVLFIIISFERETFKKSLKYLFLSIIITFGLTAIALLPQLEWQGQTTRYLLLQDRDVYPKWMGKSEFLQALLIPISASLENLWSYDTTKWIPVGKIIILLAIIGFITLKTKFKFIAAITILFSLLFVLNNVSPIYQLMIRQDLYALNRVTTRVWPLLWLFFIIIASLGIEGFIRERVSKLVLIPIIVLCMVELLFLSWARIVKPIPDGNFASNEVYNYLTQDSGQYRVFCTNSCLSQREAAKRKLELLGGYNTIAQINFFQHSWQLMGGYWGYYTLSIPPIGFQELNGLKPDPKSLGEYNVKYIVSPQKLSDPNFTNEVKIDTYYIYKNNLFKERVYFLNQVDGNNPKVVTYQPNYLKIEVPKTKEKQLFVAQVYNQGWKASLNGKKEIPIQKAPNSLNLIDIEPEVKYIELKYQPKTFEYGLAITLLTLILVVLTFFAKYFQSLFKKLLI